MINFDIVTDIITTNKTVFLLLDLDVPIDENGKIIDDEKIKNAMPTINYLVKTGARVVIATHLGYPASEIDLRFSTKPIASYLDKRMNCEVNFTRDCVGEQAKRDIFKTEYGDIIVLENLLFHKEEKNCDMNFARQIADGMNVYINDSFSFSNYSYASILAVPLFIRAAGGMLLSNTISKLDLFLSPSNKFTTAIIGGNNIATKIDLLLNLVERAKCIIVGGGVANTFLSTVKSNIGKSVYSSGYEKHVEKIIDKAMKNDCLISYPTDVRVVKSLDSTSSINKKIDEIEKDDIIVDLGEETCDTNKTILDISRCVFLYGNTGISEYKNGNLSMKILSSQIADLTKQKRIFSIASGKETILFLKTNGYFDKFSFISTSSQSTLQYMSGKVLPGIEILRRLSKQMV